jgi:hypothetical protein
MLKEIFLLLPTIFVTVNCNYCTDKCQFSLTFNDPLVVPENCPKEYGHGYITCRTIIQIDYVQKTIDINLFADENIVTGNDLYQLDIVSSFDPSNEQIRVVLQYSCVYIDECARNYTEEKFKILLDHQTILYTIKDKLYNIKSSNVQQCYDLQNKTSNCTNGLCLADLGGVNNPDDPDDVIPYYKTYCNYNASEERFQNKTGLNSTNQYGIPAVFGIFNSLHYVCNQNLCNNNENINLIQQLVNDFNNFDKISRATTISSGITITITLLLIIKSFFIY